MDPSALAGLCLLLARGDVGARLPTGVDCPTAPTGPKASVQAAVGSDLRALVTTAAARDAIARVTFAEAGNQGDSGLAAVVYTILNRLQDGRWGGTVDSVLNARSQFEPVMRAGGDWRGLPAVSPAAQARIDTILNLALEGRLPDLTHGARFFQNAVIVQGRARAGQVAASLVNFGGAAPSAVIGDHSFYTEAGRASRTIRPAQARDVTRDELVLFIGQNRAAESDSAAVADTQAEASLGESAGDPSQAMFVTPDGRVTAPQP
jgi:hypothetical protein